MKHTKFITSAMLSCAVFTFSSLIIKPALSYDELINNSKMQPVISSEDMTRANEPDIFDGVSQLNAIEPMAAPEQGEYVVINPNPMQPIIEESDLQLEQNPLHSAKEDASETAIKNMQMSPIIEDVTKKAKAKLKVRKPEPKRVKAVVKPKTQGKKVIEQAAVKADTPKIDHSWTNDVSEELMYDTFTNLEGSFVNEAVAMPKQVAVEDINDALTMPIENQEDISAPLDALSEIEANTIETMQGTKKATGETQDMDAFMHDLMRDLEAAMPNAKSQN
jgi:hypothetical protein